MFLELFKGSSGAEYYAKCFRKVPKNSKVECKKQENIFELMAAENPNKLEELREYYRKNLKDKIFLLKLEVEEKPLQILYIHDRNDELEKFVSTFSEYLPYYVNCGDVLQCIPIDDSLSEKLSRFSKTCWEGPNVPNRDTKVNGIYGELFLDFYERIVKKDLLASTYASRRDFNSKKENSGFDNVLFAMKNGKVEFVFAECKFVVNRSTAKDELIEDIKGDPSKEKTGHLTYEYINNYVMFVVQKAAYFSDDDKALLKSFMADLNNVLINEGGDFVNYLINHEITINCVFFAIFQNKSSEIKDFIDTYNKIEKEAKASLDTIGFKNYNIEIVFIPTEATSMKIKGAIHDSYAN